MKQLTQCKGIIFRRFIIFPLVVGLFASCAQLDKSRLRSILKDNPDLIVGAMKARPVYFMKAFSETAKRAEAKIKRREFNQTQQQIESYLENPIETQYDKEDVLYGELESRQEIVIYTDFQCQHCGLGNKEIKKLVKRHKGNLKVIIKHFPFSDIHPDAMIASQYFEAVRMLSKKTAQAFYEAIFDDQKRLEKLGEDFLEELVGKFDMSVEQVKKLARSDSVKKEIDADISQGRLVGISGTPSYVVNGVLLTGVHPAGLFEAIMKQSKNSSSKSAE